MSADDDRPARVDYRFLLANERTHLAYVRTALSLQVAGLGVLQFLTHGHGAIRYGLGVVLVVTGSFVSYTGYRRFRANERAIRAGADLPASQAGAVVAVVVVAVPLLAALTVAVAAAR